MLAQDRRCIVQDTKVMKYRLGFWEIILRGLKWPYGGYAIMLLTLITLLSGQASQADLLISNEFEENPILEPDVEAMCQIAMLQKSSGVFFNTGRGAELYSLPQALLDMPGMDPFESSIFTMNQDPGGREPLRTLSTTLYGDARCLLVPPGRPKVDSWVDFHTNKIRSAGGIIVSEPVRAKGPSVVHGNGIEYELLPYLHTKAAEVLHQSLYNFSMDTRGEKPREQKLGDVDCNNLYSAYGQFATEIDNALRTYQIQTKKIKKTKQQPVVLLPMYMLLGRVHFDKVQQLCKSIETTALAEELFTIWKLKYDCGLT